MERSINNKVKWENENQHMKDNLHRDHSFLNMYDGHWKTQEGTMRGKVSP